MMHVTKMHLAFLSSLGRKGNNPKIAGMVVDTIKLHARIQQEQQEQKAREEASRRAVARRAARLTTFLDAV